MLLRQIGEAIGLNFTVVTDDDYQILDPIINVVGESARKTYAHYRNHPTAKQHLPGVGDINLTSLFRDICSICHQIQENAERLAISTSRAPSCKGSTSKSTKTRLRFKTICDRSVLVTRSRPHSTKEIAYSKKEAMGLR